MTIRDRVLSFIASEPEGVSLQRIRGYLHDASTVGVDQAVAALYGDGRIERIGHGRYRIPPAKQPPLARAATDEFIQPPSLARLMAGR